MAPRMQTGKIRSSHQFSALLSSAILEWVLMLLLLLEGLLSYLVMRFARLSKLQPPCLLCTRLDHVLGKEEPGFYRDLMCNAHKAEVSSWAFCHIHRKLADVHSMCESCLLSFATEKKSNLETYRSLAGKLGVGIANAGGVHDSDWSYAAEAPCLKEVSFCSCCSGSSKMKSRAFEFLQSKAGGADITEIGISLSSSMLHNHINDMTHAGYSELKTSDSESEAPFQNGDADDLKEDFASCHPETKSADDIPSDNNALENVVVQPSSTVLSRAESIPDTVAHNAASNSMSSDVEADNKAKLQSPDLASKDAQQISSEDSDARVDNLEVDVRHNAFTSTEELSKIVDSAEFDAETSQTKAEFTNANIGKDSSRVHEDLKLLLSQMSASQILESSWNDCIASPRVQGQGEKAILHNITRTLSLERDYSGRSLAESTVGETEGESTVDRLKRQVELDRKSISLLWKELEEERNASAIAANQAMAMITRLQEEKAAMQMEASQYQRMMEEQTEYDREDLQKMTDLLAEKRREVQQLEAEIESYKRQLRDEMLVNEIPDQLHISGSKESGPSISRTTESFLVNRSLSGFEDEKAYILKCLRKLKQKLQQFSGTSKFIEASKLSTKEDDDDDEDDWEIENSVVKNYIRRNGSSYKYLSIGIKDATVSKDDPKGQYCAMISENDLASFEDEISELSERLKALEADQNFLEHSINSLKNGEECAQFIQDIAYNLRELRKIGITWKEYN